jgi:GNAT superfamily N-acetyltransferase
VPANGGCSDAEVDVAAVRAAFDEQMRRAVVAPPNATVDQLSRLTRTVATDASWCAVLWSDLSEDDADAEIAEQVGRFGEAEYFEWKHYSGDRPDDLPDRLRAAGLTPEPPEAVLVADLDEVALEMPPVPPGVRLAGVDDFSGVEAMIAVHLAVFGSVHTGTREAMRTALTLSPRPMEAVLALTGDEPVSAGRVEFSEGTQFASLWGGGTVPAWRGRGLFRALVAWRAAQARERGFRYLQVDAMPTSRPILERLGFVQIAETTPFVREAPTRG